MTLDERREMEMDRGRIIAGRAKRETDLSRLVEGKKVEVFCALPGHEHYQDHGRVNLFKVDGVIVAAQNIVDDDYPNETVMATLMLAVSATVGYDGVPSAETISKEERNRRNEYRDRYLGHWRDK